MQVNRLKKELSHLTQFPPEGICCYMKEDKIQHLRATIIGPHNSLYSGRPFELDVEITNRYPFEPPRVRFLTPIYHPNIDSNGRICLDLLKMPPSGGWKPSLALNNLLVAIQQLLAHPNFDDPLVGEIADEYRCNRAEYERKARQSYVQS